MVFLGEVAFSVKVFWSPFVERRDLWFWPCPSVRPYVRPDELRDDCVTDFHNYFFMYFLWRNEKTYRARFFNFSFFAPVKVQKHLFFVLFFNFFFIFWYFILLDVSDIFVYLVRDRSVETSPWKWAKTPVFVHF